MVSIQAIRSLTQFIKRKYFYPRSSLEISQTARISSNAKVECRFGGRIKIGENTEILDYSILWTYGGSIEIGNNCSINPFSIIYGHGGVNIGNDVLIAAHVVIIPSNHNFDSLQHPIRTQGNTSLGISIEDNVWIGTGAKILDGVTIHEGGIVGAGAVVTSNVEAYSIVGGVPARTIKLRDHKNVFND